MSSRSAPLDSLNAVPAALAAALRVGGGSGLVGLLLCLISSIPLAHLSRRAASILAFLLTAILGLVRRLRERRALSTPDGLDQLCFEDGHGVRHEVRPPS